jgi:protocatechuate 3,4-dioxygenase alpha subunit
MTELLGTTPSQTVGPFVSIGLEWADGPDVVEPGTPGSVVLAAQVVDGAGAVVTDGMVEIWHANPEGGLVPSATFRGFGRAMAGADGRYRFVTLLPGATDDGSAPHIDVLVFARGLLKQLVTRIYLPGEALNAEDPVLRSLGEADRQALTARWEDGELRFDVVLQGDGETPFFEV